MKKLTNAEGRALLAKKRAKRKPSNEDQAGLWLWAWQFAAHEANKNYFDWEAEYVFFPGRKWRFDWALVGTRVAVEVDGGHWAPGGGKHGTDADRDKLNHAASLGYKVFRFSPQQLKANPMRCVALVEKAL